MPARGAQFAHEGPTVGSPPYGKRHKVEAGWPALHPVNENIDLLGHEAESKAPVQEFVRLPGREPQIVGAQLEQITVRAQRSQRKVRLGPRREHELESARYMIDEPGDAVARRPVRKPVEVIQDQRDPMLIVQLVQLVHETRQHYVDNMRCPGGPR